MKEPVENYLGRTAKVKATPEIVGKVVGAATYTDERNPDQVEVIYVDKVGVAHYVWYNLSEVEFI